MMNRGLRPTKLLLTLAVALALLSCKSEVEHGSLKDIDVSGGREGRGQPFIKPKSEAEIKQAYIEYLKNAGSNDRLRLHALSRLAELEISASEREAPEEKAGAPQKSGSAAATTHEKQLDRIVDLLTASLSDFPNAKNNDNLLYQVKAIKHLSDLNLQIPEAVRQHIEGQQKKIGVGGAVFVAIESQPVR